MDKETREPPFDGDLFAKLHAIGTYSEGPKHDIQRWDYRDLRIVKQAKKGEPDATLHTLLGQRGTNVARGTFIASGECIERFFEITVPG